MGSPGYPPTPTSEGRIVADFDVLILGAGSGGYACALRATQLDLSVGLVEKGKVGGTCLHVGCIPTKALLHAAEVADSAREAGQFGVQATFDGVDMAGVARYREGVVSRAYKGLTGLIKSRGITLIEGQGRLTGPRSVTVDDVVHTAEHVVLASGSYARTLPGLELDGERVITSDEALLLDRVPASVIVLGGGVIGCEFASVWASFGAAVTIVEALPRLLPTEDEASSKALERAFRKRRITLRTGTPFQSVKTTGSGVAVTVEGGDVLEADLLLVAVGRGPVTDGLGYEEQGLALERGFVVTDERLRTNLPGVYAVGDIVPGLQLAHRGFQQGIFVAEQIAGLDPAPIDETGIPRVTYSHPEVASVGLERAAGDGAVRRRRRAHRDLRPRWQRQEPDPQDPGLRQAGRRSRTAPSSASTSSGDRVGELIGEAQLIYGWEGHAADVAPLVHAHPTQNEALGEAHLLLAGKPLHTHS